MYKITITFTTYSEGLVGTVSRRIRKHYIASDKSDLFIYIIKNIIFLYQKCKRTIFVDLMFVNRLQKYNVCTQIEI